MEAVGRLALPVLAGEVGDPFHLLQGGPRADLVEDEQDRRVRRVAPLGIGGGPAGAPHRLVLAVGVLRLEGRPAAAMETMALERAIRAACNPILDSFRAEFRAQVTELEEGMGLYAAMARLPERQFDVMVLQYAPRLSHQENRPGQRCSVLSSRAPSRSYPAKNTLAGMAIAVMKARARTSQTCHRRRPRRSA